MSGNNLNDKGIYFCAPMSELGFRGFYKGDARLAPVDGTEEGTTILGVDISTGTLPHLPDMSAGSDFIEKGHWYHYPINGSVFIWYRAPNGPFSEKFIDVIYLARFKGEDNPRVLVDNRQELINQGILTEELQQIVADLLKEKGFEIA